MFLDDNIIEINNFQRETDCTVALFTNKVDTDKPYYKVEVIGEQGILALSRPWLRGDQILIQEGSVHHEATKDSDGVSWLDKKSENYKVTRLDSKKDAKPKEQVSLDVEESDEDSLVLDTTEEEKPKPRGRRKTTPQE